MLNLKMNKEWQKKLFIVLPAWNEEKSIGKVLRMLKNKGYKNLIVVDDGSKDRTYDVAKKHNVIVLKHIINRGLGGALGTGIEKALDMDAKVILTFDSDGQHSVDDIPKMTVPIFANKVDVVIGSRLMNSKGMPISRKIGNWGFNVITLLLFNIWTSDSQSGLRAFSRKAAHKIKIKTNRMEVSSEIIKEIGRNKLSYAEVPIKVIYTDESLAGGENSFWNGFKILRKLIIRSLMK